MATPTLSDDFIDIDDHNSQINTYYMMNHKEPPSQLFIINNFLSNSDLDKLSNILQAYLHSQDDNNNVSVTSHIKFSHSSVGWHPYYSPHWNFNLTDNDFFSVYLLSKIRSISDWTQSLQLKRAYCSCQTSQQLGNWHYDDDKTNSYTFTLYYNMDSFVECKDKLKQYNMYSSHIKELNCPTTSTIHQDYSKYDIDGDFHIKYPNHNIKTIKTKNNTAVLFNSTTLHNGDCHNYNTNFLRLVVAFKLYIP